MNSWSKLTILVMSEASSCATAVKMESNTASLSLSRDALFTSRAMVCSTYMNIHIDYQDNKKSEHMRIYM